MGRSVLEAKALFADDNPVMSLAPRTGKTTRGWAWTYIQDERPWNGEAPPTAQYRFSADRKAAHPKAQLKGFAGWMLSHGYAGTAALARAGPVREVACLAHVRRKFFDFHSAQGPAIAAKALERFAALYAIEKDARATPRSPAGKAPPFARPAESARRPGRKSCETAARNSGRATPSLRSGPPPSPVSS